MRSLGRGRGCLGCWQSGTAARNSVRVRRRLSCVRGQLQVEESDHLATSLERAPAHCSLYDEDCRHRIDCLVIIGGAPATSNTTPEEVSEVLYSKRQGVTALSEVFVAFSCSKAIVQQPVWLIVVIFPKAIQEDSEGW